MPRWPQRYRALVQACTRAKWLSGERRHADHRGRRAAVRRLLAMKDEYEVARLYTDGRFQAALAEQFEDAGRLNFHMAPPLLARRGPDGKPRKMSFGPWMMSAFAHSRAAPHPRQLVRPLRPHRRAQDGAPAGKRLRAAAARRVAAGAERGQPRQCRWRWRSCPNASAATAT
jgi:hypothetical protein